jgi:DNA-binding CsgD family transcriptional regulator
MKNAREYRRLMEKLRLLCGCGAGLEAVAVPVCDVMREMADVVSASMFWFDSDGLPAGYYHDCTNVEVKDLFVTRLGDLFSDPAQFNIVSLARRDGPAIGRMVGEEMQDHFRQSNVYKYLAKPLGHEYCLDMRVEVGDRTAAVVALWNEEGPPFTHADVVAMEPILAQLQAAASGPQEATWRTVSGGRSQLITNRTGERLIAIDQECEDVLVNAHLLMQSIPFGHEMGNAPAFCRQLAAQLDRKSHARLDFPINGGRLECTASRAMLRAADTGLDDGLIIVSVTVQHAEEVEAAIRLNALPLTFRQKEIGLYAMRDLSGAEISAATGCSAEAVKKHLAAVYRACEVAGRAELRQFLLS